MTVDENSPADRERPILEHLDDLRKVVLISLGALVVGVAVTIPFLPALLRMLSYPVIRSGVADAESFVQVIDIMSGFNVGTRLALWSGVVMACPVIIVAAACFIFPALRARERRAVLPLLVASVALFAFGALSAFYLVMPVAIRWLYAANQWLGITCEFIRLDDYVGFVGQVMLCFGLAFELPVVVLVLGYLGIVNSSQLREKRRHALVVIAALAMVLTPGPDPFSMIAVAIPMAALFEICIWMIRARELARG